MIMVMLWKRKVGFTADASVFCFFLNQCPEDASVLEWNVQVLTDFSNNGRHVHVTDLLYLKDT